MRRTKTQSSSSSGLDCFRSWGAQLASLAQLNLELVAVFSHDHHLPVFDSKGGVAFDDARVTVILLWENPGLMGERPRIDRREYDLAARGRQQGPAHRFALIEKTRQLRHGVPAEAASL